MEFITQHKRTHYCGKMNADHIDQRVTIMGWVDSRRDLGALIFINLRDRTGVLQVVFDPSQKDQQVARDFRHECVVAVHGKVRSRPKDMINKKMVTGEIEVEAAYTQVLSMSQVPPFQLSDPNVSESLRLKYRYLDLRTQRLQKFMKTRHQITFAVREFLNDQGFYEIETPILYKSTPEGAKDYLVPSRVHPGTCYALPQSPQTLKQLLMISGFDRYYQVARCFRDEDLRSDRQPEFTQIDLEMSFVDVEDILQLNEKMMQVIWKKIKGVELPPIPRMTYNEAMERYGCDKPDIRFSMELKDLKEIVAEENFKVFTETLSNGGVVKGIAALQCGTYSRGQFDKLTKRAQKSGAKGLVWIKSEGGQLLSPVSKFFSEEKLKEIFSATGAKEGDAALIVADDFYTTSRVLSDLRLYLGKELKLIDETQDAFLWVVDFPLLEYSQDEKRWHSCHHPFTMVTNESEKFLLGNDERDYSKTVAKSYDLVCNGYELGSGSIRVHRSDIQNAIFKALGLSEKEIQEKFGYFIEALSYGTPPHGGFACGMDRLVMVLCQTEAIREVIAFPKTTQASDLMSQTPSPVEDHQLTELSLKWLNLKKPT